MAKNVLTGFKIDANAETFVHITCRPSGLLNWLLNLIGIVGTSSLTANRECLDFKTTSLKGFESVTAPLPCVTTVTCGLRKPLNHLISAIVCFLLGTIGAAAISKYLMLFLLLAIVYGVLYYLGKSFFIGFMNGGDRVYGVEFHASVIEGIKVDNDKVNETCALIRQEIIKSHAK